MEMECGSWSHKECFLFITFESDSIRVSGLYSGWGPRSFSYDIQSDKGRMSMNSLWINLHFQLSEELHWRFRDVFIIISIEGEFICHCVESGIDMKFNDTL